MVKKDKKKKSKSRSKSPSKKGKDGKKKGSKGKEGLKHEHCYHVLGVKYEYGKLCTFCTNLTAVVYCPECVEGDGQTAVEEGVDAKHPHGKAARKAKKEAEAKKKAAAAAAAAGVGGGGDFLCEKCDWEKHKHQKRCDHVRTILSSKPMDENARIVKSFFQIRVARRKLLENCRSTFRRFYDSKARTYFYYREDTFETTWQKPYCLKLEELVPMPTPDFSARKIQGMYRSYHALHLVRYRCILSYDKIWSREEQRFYYFNNGNSLLLHGGIEVPTIELVGVDGHGYKTSKPCGLVKIDQVLWEKPCMMGTHDIRPMWTEDVAAMRIQGMWKLHEARAFIRSIVRGAFQQKTDPLSGKHFYYNTHNHHTAWEIPDLLGNERWNPNDIREWEMEDVVIWLRRMKLKMYTKAFQRFNIDGPLLLSLDWDDFVDLGINLSVDIKRILLQYEMKMKKVDKNFFDEYKPAPEEVVRRERLRRHHKIEHAAIIIQRKYMLRYARERMRRLKQVVKLKHDEELRERERLVGLKWYDERAPEYSGPHMYQVNHTDHKIAHIGKFDLHKYGRRNEYKSAQGWGRWTLGDEIENPVDAKGREIVSKHGFADARWEAVENDDEHVSRKFGVELERQAGRIKEQQFALHFTGNKCLSRKPIIDPVNTGKEHKAHGMLVAKEKI